MKKTTICFCLREDTVLLAMKRKGFGSGKWNGYGGKVEENESPAAAAVRELKEESGLIAKEQELAHVGIIRFFFEEEAKFECYVYVALAWKGEPADSDEMHNARWYEFSNLPLTEMWAADGMWIPLILEGKKIKADVRFSADGASVKEFTYKTQKDFIS
jgi:8-oxo-dGTP diphosphatase